MKLVYTLSFLLLFSISAAAQVITDFDPEFKQELIDKGIDINGDGEIQFSEAELVDSLNVIGYLRVNRELLYEMTDDAQLKYFKNLKYLRLVATQFDTIDLRGFTKLESFSTDWYTAYNIIADSLTNLKTISTSFGFHSLSLNGTENVERLSCWDHFGLMPDLDYSKLTKLKELSLGGVSGFEVLNLDPLVNLETFTLSEFGGYLKFMTIKNGRYTEIGGIQSYGTLQYICTDESEIGYVKSKIISGDTEVNTYCSFEKGGTIKQITGTNYLDLDGDGCDTNDLAMPNLRYEMVNTTTGESENKYAFDGSYKFQERVGSYRIKPYVANPEYYKITPEYSDVTITESDSEAYLDFCIEKIGDKHDAGGMIYSTGRPRPGFTTTYNLSYGNYGNTTTSGELILKFDNDHMTFVSSSVEAESLDHGEMIWSFNDLLPNEFKRIKLKFEMNRPTDSEFPLMGGENLKFDFTINTEENDDDLKNNEFILRQTVVNSFDPNDITCLEGDSISYLETGDYVHYMVRFENTGTAEAINIVVKDTINGEKFDLDSFTPMEGSHPYVTRINDDGIAEFIFENINLPFTEEEKHGYVIFKIKTKESLIEGDQFANNASIYFDYNFPIHTNEYETQVIGVVLPVRLSSFDAIVNKQKVSLNWQVQWEENLSHYLVERRHEDDDQFSTVAREEARTVTNYSTIDKQLVQTGAYYYRLKIVDNDGQVQYSDVISVEVKNGNQTFEVYPNPASEYLMFENSTDGIAVVRIHNSAGQEVDAFNFESYSNKQVDLTNFNRGLYFINIQLDGKTEVKKIFVDK